MSTTVRPLTPAQMEILEFERTPWKYLGAKETAILERFDCSPARYFQQLNQVLDLPAAEAYDPPLVRRLRRLRDARQAARGGRSFGFDIAGGAR